MKRILVFFCIMMWPIMAISQLVNTQYSFNFGIRIHLNYEVSEWSKETFPGIKAFIGMNIFSRVDMLNTTQGAVNISTSLGIYNKALGNSLNLGFQDNQIDWTTTVGVGWLSRDSSYTRLLQSINNVPFYNIRHDASGMGMIGVNFIMNNNRRNQTNGFVAFTIDQFSLTYYNDGAPPISWFAIGDQFDRYWTGGTAMYWHQEDEMTDNGAAFVPYNIWEVAFDQFTGYTNQMYELSGIFGIDVQNYDIYNRYGEKDSIDISVRPEGKRSRPTGFSYNASAYEVRYFWGPNMGVSGGMLGSLRSHKKGKAYGLQDFIHIMRGDPVHPNISKNRLFIGLSYNDAL
jgi:hypothetical protein